MSTEQVVIKLRDRYLPSLLSRGMNKAVLNVKPFRLRPVSFTSHIEGLKPKFFEAAAQRESFLKLIENPWHPQCYCISGNPNDRQAKAAAAFLMQNAFIKSHKRPPLWHDLMGGFHNDLVGHNAPRPGMLVITGVVPNSTQVKFEKLRDILEYHADIPRIIVTAGLDPFTFFNKFLYYSLSGCCYLPTTIVKNDVEI